MNECKPLMLGFALNSKKLKDKLMDTSQLINEINIGGAVQVDPIKPMLKGTGTKRLKL